MNLETAISLGYYLSTFGFLAATIMMGTAVRQFGKSALGSIFSYFFIGTSIFFIITIFQTLGGDFFGISDESMDVWWHLMFYMAMFSYYIGLRGLVNLGSANQSSGTFSVSPKAWGIGTFIVLGIIFLIAGPADSIVSLYAATPVAELGLHHFLAFIFAGTVGLFLLRAKKNIGQIGLAIANPMIVAVWALSLQHLWELQFESWKTVIVTSNVGEGGEKIFLTIAALGVTFAAMRLRTYSRR